VRKWALLLALYGLLALGAATGLLARNYDVQQERLEAAPPCAQALLGTDHLGRDVLARVVQGARIAFFVGSLAAGIALFLGALLGLLAGWYGGWLDEAAVWISGAVAAIPGILLILAIGFMLGPGETTVITAIGLAAWVWIFRLVRAEVLRLKVAEFVLAARAAGAGGPRILFRHLLPNLKPLLTVQFTLQFVYAVKTEVVVSFLGVGMVNEPSWGAMIAHARDDLPQGRWWPLTFATLAMFGLVLAVQALGDHLRD